MFDLDGTLTRHDTLVPYLLTALGTHPARARGLLAAPFAVAAFLLKRDHGRLKSQLIRSLLGGLTRDDIAGLTQRFLDAKWPTLFHPRALAALAEHRAAGDYLVILSASTDCYVRDIGRRLGVDEVICTELLWQSDRLDGALATANRRGPEKMRCIEALRARHPGAAIAAYGNAGSDLEHLAAVEAGVLINGSPTAVRAAEALGVPHRDWH